MIGLRKETKAFQQDMMEFKQETKVFQQDMMNFREEALADFQVLKAGNEGLREQLAQRSKELKEQIQQTEEKLLFEIDDVRQDVIHVRKDSPTRTCVKKTTQQQAIEKINSRGNRVTPCHFYLTRHFLQKPINMPKKIITMIHRYIEFPI